MSLLEYLLQGWETVVYTLVLVWGGYVFGQLSAHWWYFNHYKSTLKRRIYQPRSKFDSVQKRLASEGEKRLELLDRKATESDVRAFTAAIAAGFYYFLREYLNDW